MEKGKEVKLTSPSPEDIQTRELWGTAIIVLKIMQYITEVIWHKLICALCFMLLHMWTIKEVVVVNSNSINLGSEQKREHSLRVSESVEGYVRGCSLIRPLLALAAERPVSGFKVDFPVFPLKYLILVMRYNSVHVSKVLHLYSVHFILSFNDYFYASRRNFYSDINT